MTNSVFTGSVYPQLRLRKPQNTSLINSTSKGRNTCQRSTGPSEREEWPGQAAKCNMLMHPNDTLPKTTKQVDDPTVSPKPFIIITEIMTMCQHQRHGDNYVWKNLTLTSTLHRQGRKWNRRSSCSVSDKGRWCRRTREVINWTMIDLLCQCPDLPLHKAASWCKVWMKM